MATQEGDLTGRVIASQFRIERLLGKGGMGAVYLAEQLEMGRRVVIKVMNPALLGGAPDLEERFRREARVVAQLNHPNVVQVYVFGRTEDGQLYIAMEYIEGRNLKEVVTEKGALPEARALRIMDQICDALIEAHDLGLVHRDLKPDNIMLTERHGTADYVKVLDFGIAKLTAQPDAKLTQTGAIFGTPQYMAPEQAQGKKIDQRTDIYALGIILYEMLTGQLPFTAESALDYLIKHISAPVEPPTRRFSGLIMLPRTEAIITRALEKGPEARFQSVSEMQREVRHALRDRPDAGKPFPTPDAPVASRTAVAAALGATMATPAAGGGAPASPPRKSSGGLVAAGVAALVVVGAGAYALVGRRADPPPTPAPPVATSSPPARAPAPPKQPTPDEPAVEAPVVGVPQTRPVEPPPPKLVPRPKPVRLPKTVAAAAEPADPPADPPTDVPVPAAGPPIEGLPAPKGAELTAATPQALVLRTALPPEAVLAFYRHHLGRAYPPIAEIPNGLQLKSARAPVTYVVVARAAGGTTVSMTRNALAPAPAPARDEVVFGVRLPPGAEATVRTGTSAVFQVSRPVKEIVRFYRKLFDDAKGINFVETMVEGAPYLVITAEAGAQPFQNVAVMNTPDSLKPSPGVWTQISLTRRP